MIICDSRMEGKSSDLKRLEIEEKEAEKQDLIDMEKELELIKKCEIEEVSKKFFTSSLCL